MPGESAAGNDRVHDGLRLPRQLQDPLRRDPASDVLPVTEHEHERAPERGIRQRQGRETGVVQGRGEPGAGELDRGMRLRAVPALDDGEIDALGEGEQGEGVVRARASTKRCAAALSWDSFSPATLELVSRARIAWIVAASCDELGLLASAFVEELEVRRREVPDRCAVARDRDVEPDHFDRRAEGEHLRGLPVHREEEQQGDNGALHERAALRSASIAGAARRPRPRW